MMKKNNIVALLSVFSAFLVMGFVDIVGIATNFVKSDFNLSDTEAGFLPSMIFLWFLICSLPTGILMNKIGRKNTVLLSIGVTGVAMLLPLLVYTKEVVFAAFALLGIGNTILQAALTPLLSNVVPQEKVSSSISLGQFTKSIAWSPAWYSGQATGSMSFWRMRSARSWSSCCWQAHRLSVKPQRRAHCPFSTAWRC
jgi:MFS transporter, FHS family, L-fucose permease